MFYRLEKKQRLAIKLLLNKKHKLEEIAKICGVSRMTHWKWRQEPSFQKVLEIEKELHNR
ncbi:hypothetical protein BTR23_10480 [Alkalihalophilus pseudofirmus]|nr:hypothetical protein BTR23_10480 [Alkalihalophilus pseudofirmus]